MYDMHDFFIYTYQGYPGYFRGAPLTFNGASGNIQDNLTGMFMPSAIWCLMWYLLLKRKVYRSNIMNEGINHAWRKWVLGNSICCCDEVISSSFLRRDSIWDCFAGFKRNICDWDDSLNFNMICCDMYLIPHVMIRQLHKSLHLTYV